MSRGAHQAVRQALRERLSGPASGVQQREDVERCLQPVVIVHRVESTERREVGRAPPQPGPEVHPSSTMSARSPATRRADLRRHEASVRWIEKHPGRATRRSECNQGPLPEDLVPTHPHGGKQEPVPEQPALDQRRLGRAELFRGSDGAIQEPVEVPGPKLAIASHGLVVQAQCLWGRAEQDLADPIHAGIKRQLIVVAMDSVPSVSPGVGVSDQLPLDRRRIDAGMKLVQPAGLRDAESVRASTARHGVQEWDLERQRQLQPKPSIGRHAPEDQALRARQQMERRSDTALEPHPAGGGRAETSAGSEPTRTSRLRP